MRYRVIIAGCRIDSYVGPDLDVAEKLYDALVTLYIEQRDDTTNVYLDEAVDEHTWQTIKSRLVDEEEEEEAI